MRGQLFIWHDWGVVQQLEKTNNYTLSFVKTRVGFGPAVNPASPEESERTPSLPRVT